MKIRNATIDDVPAVVRLAYRMHGDSTFADMDFDARKTARTALECIEYDGRLALVAEDEDEGELIGLFFAVMVPAFFGHDLTASDLGVFVVPEKRGGHAAAGLIRRFVEWARGQGCKRMTIANSAGMDDKLFLRLTERLGFTRTGSLVFMRGE